MNETPRQCQRTASLDEVLCTDRLHQRPWRAPDYERENRALGVLAQALADSPQTILQRLTEVAMEVCDAGSAGISLLKEENGERFFYWPAIAGAWKPHIGGGMPHDASPCGVVVDSEAVQLFSLPERYYTYMVAIAHPIKEALLAPFSIDGKAVGTVWLIAHDESRRFDAEDARLLQSLANFASAAHQIWRSAMHVVDQHQGPDDRFRRLADNAPVMLWVTEPNGYCSYLSTSWYEFTGQARDSGVGFGWLDAVHPDDRETSARRFEESMRDREPFRIENRVRRSDGEYRWAIDFAQPRFGEDHEFLGYVGSVIDITEHKQAEEALAQATAEAERQRRFYDTIISSTPDLVYVFDRNYRFTFINKALLDMWGRTMEDSLGKSLLEIGYEPWHAEMHEREIDKVVATKQPIRGEVPFRHATLGWRIYDYIFVPVLNDQGEVESVAGTTRDVTDRKQAEDAMRKSEERLRLAKSAARLGIHDYNIEANTIDWDERTRALWGAEPDEIITYDIWRQGLHRDDRDAAEDAVRRAVDPKGDGDYFAEYRVTSRKDRICRWIQATGQVTFVDGKAIRLVGTALDITDQKHAEESLREADRRKDDFLATLAHELRNPLAAIRMAADLLQRGKEDPAQVESLIGVIDRQSSQLTRLIDDLLDVNRITRGKIELRKQPVDLNSIITHAAESTRAICDAEGLQLSISLPSKPIVVEGDPTRLAQVIGNLLSNACKFTDSGGYVRVVAEEVEGHAVVRVRDTGIGIAPEKLRHIFEMFAQIKTSPGRATSGLGIGLSLARQLVERHGGIIEARSEGPGKGSEFTIRLPLIAASPQVSPADLSMHADRSLFSGQQCDTKPAAHRRRILAVDDNRDALDTIALLLKLAGHEVHLAEDGEQALAAAQEHRPDVMLLDIGLPGIDGYEVARRIRSQSWGRDLRLIAMTGWGQEKDKQSALDAGFDAHVTKPADPQVLEQLLTSDARA